MPRALTRIAGIAASAVIVLWGAATLAFLAFRIIPGDAVTAMLGAQAQVSESAKAAIRADLGLDQPPLVQYLSYLGGVLHGDLGRSYQLRMPVTEVIAGQLGPTLQLTALALLIAVVLAVAAALFARHGVARGIVVGLELVVLSSPVFWIGILLLAVFSFWLGWFPVAGSRTPATLVLPAVTLALPVAALIGQVLRDGIDQAERQPFAETVRARGAGPARLVLRHSLRHGAANTLTLAAYLTGSLLGGAVLVETVFARPGIGRVTLAAILNRDLPVVAGIIMLSALVFVIVNVLVELAHPLLDPRMRASRRAFAEPAADTGERR